jgi:FdhE protein
MIRSKWDSRIQRAEELAETHPFAGDVLRFYKDLALFQKSLYNSLLGACRDGSGDTNSYIRHKELPLDLLLSRFPEFLCVAENIGTPPIVESSRKLRSQSRERLCELLIISWEGTLNFRLALGDTETFLAWIFLQPYAEFLADRNPHAATSGRMAVCPFCSAKPLVGVLRPEGDGGRRSLICSVCSTEWTFGRIICPGCGEENVEKLVVYTASQFNHVRVEACDTCRRYIKTIDLTKNGRAVPIVDELATIPLNLWATEHRYTKLQVNLLGL